MKEIKARDGYYLTQVEVAEENRLFLTAIKGANINESDWREATEEEKIAYEEAIAKKQEEMAESEK
jgi:hypothetical protein